MLFNRSRQGLEGYVRCCDNYGTDKLVCVVEKVPKSGISLYQDQKRSREFAFDDYNDLAAFDYNGTAEAGVYKSVSSVRAKWHI